MRNFGTSLVRTAALFLCMLFVCTGSATAQPIANPPKTAPQPKPPVPNATPPRAPAASGDADALKEAILKRVSASIVIVRDLGLESSGIVIDGSGLILTNVYSILTVFPVEIVATVEARGERRTEKFDRYEIVGFSPSKDQVMIHITLKEGRLIPATPSLISSKAGQDCVIVGAASDPKDRAKLTHTFQSGLISDPQRKIENDEFIQTDAEITSSSLGGGLFDKSGALLGIVEVTALNKNGLGFAVSIKNLPRSQFKKADSPVADAKVAARYMKLAEGQFNVYGDLMYRLAAYFNPNDADLLLKAYLGASNRNLRLAFLTRATEVKPDDAMLWSRLSSAYDSPDMPNEEKVKLMKVALRKVIDTSKPGENFYHAYMALESLTRLGDYPPSVLVYVNRWRLTEPRDEYQTKSNVKIYEDSKHGLSDAQLAILDRPDFKFSWARLDEFVAAGKSAVPQAPTSYAAGDAAPGSLREAIEAFRRQRKPTSAEGTSLILPERSQQFKIARGGCMLAMRFASFRTLSILNLATGEFQCHIPIDETTPTWGVGDRVMLVWTPSDRKLTAYDIENGKVLRSAVLPGTSRIISIAMSNFRDDSAIVATSDLPFANGSPARTQLTRLDVIKLEMQPLRIDFIEMPTETYESYADRDLTLVGALGSNYGSGKIVIIEGMQVREPKNNGRHMTGKPLFGGRQFLSTDGVEEREGREDAPFRTHRQNMMYPVIGEDQYLTVRMKGKDDVPHGQIISAADGKVVMELNITQLATNDTEWFPSGPLQRLVHIDDSQSTVTIYDYDALRKNAAEVKDKPAAK